MDEPGILLRRNTKAVLISNPPVLGELVYAVDTDEHGWLQGDSTLVWKKLDFTTEIPADIVLAPAGVLPALDASNLTGMPLGVEEPLETSYYSSDENAGTIIPITAIAPLTQMDNTKWMKVRLNIWAEVYYLNYDGGGERELINHERIMYIPPKNVGGFTFFGAHDFAWSCLTPVFTANYTDANTVDFLIENFFQYNSLPMSVYKSYFQFENLGEVDPTFISKLNPTVPFE